MGLFELFDALPKVLVFGAILGARIGFDRAVAATVVAVQVSKAIRVNPNRRILGVVGLNLCL